MSVVFLIAVFSLAHGENQWVSSTPECFLTVSPFGFQMCSNLCFVMPDCQFYLYHKASLHCTLLEKWKHPLNSTPPNVVLTPLQKPRMFLNAFNCGKGTRFMATRTGRYTCVPITYMMGQRIEASAETRKPVVKSPDVMPISHITSSYKNQNVVYGSSRNAHTSFVKITVHVISKSLATSFKVLLMGGAVKGLTTGPCEGTSSPACIFILWNANTRSKIYYLREKDFGKYTAVEHVTELSTVSTTATALARNDKSVSFMLLRMSKTKFQIVEGASALTEPIRKVNREIQFFDLNKKSGKVLLGSNGDIVLTYLYRQKKYLLRKQKPHTPVCLANKSTMVLVLENASPFKVSFLKVHRSW